MDNLEEDDSQKRIDKGLLHLSSAMFGALVTLLSPFIKKLMGDVQ